MIEFTKILIEGFCSIPQLELSLNTKGITIIRGANGWGKTSIFSALVWALYGKNLKGVPEVNTWEKYREKGYCGTKVEVYFKSNNSVNRIIRCLKYTKEVEGSKGNNRLIYQIDGVSISDKGKRDIQDVIVDHLGMSYNLFINSIMFGQGLKRLIQESGTSQRELFEEIFDLGYLTKAKKIAYCKYQVADSEYNNLVSKIDNLNRSIENLDENQSLVEKKKKDFLIKKEEEIRLLRKEVEKLKRDKDSLLKNIKNKDIDYLNNIIDRIDKKIKIQKEKLRVAKSNTGISLEELIDIIIKLLKEEKYESSLNLLLKLRSDFKIQYESGNKINRLQSRKSHVYNKISRLKNTLKDIENIDSHISRIDRDINSKQSENPDFDSIYKNNHTKLRGFKKELRKCEEDSKIYKDNRDIYHWAYTDPFGNNGIKSYLFESCLHQLNDILGDYSDILGFSIQFSVDLSSVRKEFKTTINFEGQEVSYDELSGGQKQLVNLAMAFSMNNIISQAQGINIAFLDEVFESLSEDNIEIVVELIKKIYQDKTLFLITHLESLPISNARVLRVKRVKGLSKYEL